MRVARLLVFVGTLSGATQAAKLDVRESDASGYGQLSLGYVRLSNQDGDKIHAVTGHLSFVKGLFDRFGIQGDVEQAFAPSDGFSAAYTRFAVGPTYSLVGSTLGRKRSQVFLGDTPLVSSVGDPGQQLRVSLTAEQMLLNGSTRLLGLAGFGIGLHYDYPLNGLLTLVTGLKWARMSNSTITLKPLQIEAGVRF